MSNPKAIIRRQGNLIQVIPDYHLYLSPVLMYTRRIAKAGGSMADYEKTLLYKFDQNTLIVPAGLTSRVVTTLRSNGIEPVIEDLRPNVVPPPDFSKLQDLRDGQDEMIVQIVANDWGVIEGPTGVGKSYMIKQIVRMWPTANIIIASPFSGLVHQLYQELLEMYSIHEVGICGDGKHAPKRITVAMDRSLMHCRLEKCQVFIYDEVHRAAAPKCAEAISKIWNARRYGFSASPKGRSDNADLETEAMFGPVIYRSTYQEVQRKGYIVPIKVHMLDCSTFTEKHDYTSTVVMERRGVWRNDERNLVIANGVRWALQKYGEDAQILVIVRTLDHLVHLAKYLPEFTLVYGSMDPDKKKKYVNWGLIDPAKHPITAKERGQHQDDFRSGKLRRVIATGNANGVWSTGVDFPYLEILVRADAQGSDIQNTQIAGRVSRKPKGASEHDDGTKSEGILLDCNDIFNSTLQKRAAKRMASYRKKGWTIDTINLSAPTPLFPGS